MMRYSPLLVLALVFAMGIPAAAQNKKREKPSAQTLAAGSEVPWRASVAAALEDAKSSGRPVFWYIPTVAGSPMDRKPEIDHYMMAGPFADAQVATLLARKFVNLKLEARGEDAKRYGLKRLEFIEPGFLVLNPEGEEIYRIHEITTLASEWFVWQLRHVLDQHPKLAAPSDAVAEATSKNDVARLAERLVEESAFAEAAKVLEKLGETPSSDLLRAKVYIAFRDETAALARLTPLLLGTPVMKAHAALDLGRLHLRAGRYGLAAEFFANAFDEEVSPVRSEALLLSGMAHHLLGATQRAREDWSRATAVDPESRYARKASAELQRLGPFSRAMERVTWLPADAFVPKPDGTCIARDEAQVPMITQASVELLLSTQNDAGAWDDSNYDFGGTDSLPNVYVAGTALAGLALLEWRHLDPKRVDSALERATRYLLDESHLALEDQDEIVWAHSYRLLYFAKLIEKNREASSARKKAIDIAKELARSQLKTGSWRHEYPNPFTTASVLHALATIGAAGVPTGKEILTLGTEALKKSRGEDGTISYAFGRSGGSPPGFSAGRSPIAEVALLKMGASDPAKLTQAIRLSEENHHYLEAIRKYDDHADSFRNGGFFFWYALHGRLLAIEALTDPSEKRSMLRKLRETVLSISEIDGGFIDSHELGKTYGTAMGLILLAGTQEAPQ